MYFGDAKPQAIPRYGSVVQWDDKTQLPLGLADIVRNCRYTAQSVGTRWGFSKRLSFGAQGSSVTGLGILRYIAADTTATELINLLAYTAADGNLWSAVPFQPGSVAQLSTDALLAQANILRTPGLNPLVVQAFNRGYMALGDLTKGVAPAMVYDPMQATLDPVSDKPIGAAWEPNTRYRVGQIVSPSTFQTFGLPAALGVWVPKITGYVYRCKVAGISAAAQPAVWPTAEGADVVDGGVTWEEATPICESGLPDPAAPITPTTAADAGSPILAGATVFVVLTYNSASGESINEIVTAQGGLDTTKVLQFLNTTGGPVDLTVTMPAIPADVAAGGPLGANGATSYNAYAYIVPAGAPDPSKYLDSTYYARFASNVAPGGTATLSAWPSGASLPDVNTAVVADAGNVDTGVRWMVQIFETRTEYQNGFTVSAPVRVNVTQTGLKVLLRRAFIGPYNCVRRICAFTVAGASAAGPYTYVDQDDVLSPGFNQPDIPITSTALNDNVTTTAQFNFTDQYLPGGSDITNYLQRVELPPCADVYFSKALQRNIYTGVLGYPSGHLISEDQGDVEGVRVPGSNLQVAESDGDRTVCWREIRQTQVSCKENSGYGIVPNDGDPSTWGTTPDPLWTGSGPVGPKAIAHGISDDSEFLIWAHRTGPYRYTGGSAEHIGREVQTIWDNINWDYGYLISVAIDEKNREVRFSVPYGASTVLNKVITVSYYFGWGDPVVFVQRRGILVPNVEGRKWSVDDISANQFVYTPRRQAVGAVAPGGADLRETLMLAGPDGAIYTLVPGQYYDQNYAGAQVGYFSQWVSVPGPNPTLALYQMMGASCSAIGAGFCNVYAYDEKGKLFPLSSPTRPWTLQAASSSRDFGAIAAHAERFGIGFDNGGVPGAWFEMHVSELMLVQTYASRLG